MKKICAKFTLESGDEEEEEKGRTNSDGSIENVYGMCACVRAIHCVNNIKFKGNGNVVMEQNFSPKMEIKVEMNMELEMNVKIVDA